MPSFSAEYKRLNSEQKLAVDTVEGPLMVVAGPGTGKTQVLAMRVANILKKTHAKPANILCLTYSTSGATAMRERLRSLIGPDAYGVTVSTIHGFSNDIIQSNPIVFDDWSTLEQISDIERYRTVKKCIDAMLPDLVLVNKKNPYLRIRDILGRFSQLKREGKTDPEDLRNIALEHEASLSVKSREGTKAHTLNLLRGRKFKELIELFLRYQDSLRSSGRYDYDDMILTVIEALKENDWLLSGLQERYQYILVDEFQDTNGAQYDLIELLTKPRTPEDKPNLFVVGDDDQAIYRFQGANLQNILKFHKRFQAAPIVVLKTSYRCSQSILDAAGKLISVNTERLVGKIEGLRKDLVSPSKSAGTKPCLLFTPSDATESWMIADIIEERMKEGIEPQKIAVLTQTNKELRPIYDTLRARAIPVQFSGKLDLLQHPLVHKAIVLFQAGFSPEDSGKMSDAMSLPFFGCKEIDLALIYEKKQRNESLYSFLLQFNAAGRENPLVLHDLNAVIHARDTILHIHQSLSCSTIVETFECILKHTGILPNNPHDIDPIDFSAVQTFFDAIKYRAYEQPSFSARGFADDLNYYLEPEYGDLRMTYELPHLTDAGVALMTAHKSKGLEFDVVILPNFREKHWDHRIKPAGVSMPEDLLFGWQSEQKKFEADQDERRVAFVAITRARCELIFTCPKQQTRGDIRQSVSPSSFFAEAGELNESERELKNPEAAATLLFDPIRDSEEEFKTFLRKRIETYKLSVTALNHFLEDPVLFLRSDLLQVPQSKQSSLVYGNAVHDALKQWGFSMQKGQPLTKAQFLLAFESFLQERELLMEAEKQRLLKLGEESLPRYFHEHLESLRPYIAHIEHPVSTHLGDIPITGKLDRIDRLSPDSSTVRVIDFKTGRPKSESEILKEGDYFRQLVFYALLLEHGMPHLEPKEFILEFVGEGEHEPVSRVFQITEAQKRDLAAVIQKVWAKILALDFTPIQ